MTCAMDNGRATCGPAVKRQNVYQILRREIIEGRYGSDEPLVERILSERLGVSRSPVKDALKLLEAEGFVRSIRGGGTFVVPVTLEDYVELAELKLAFESAAAALTAKRPPAGVLETLAACCEQLEQSCAAGDAETSRRCAEEFHETLVRSCGNGRLVHEWEKSQAQMERFLHSKAAKPLNAKAALAQHTAILKAIQAGDPEKTRSITIEHAHWVQEEYIKSYM